MIHRTTARIVLAAALVLALALVPTSLAGKGKPGGGGKPGGSQTGSFSLVLLESTDGYAHWGQQVTFEVTSTATYTFVDLDCYQNGTRVYHSGVGFYAGWPWSQNFTLSSGAWTGGAADCGARLYWTKADGSNPQTLATMTFPVYA